MAKYRVLFSVRGVAGYADESIQRAYTALATAALATPGYVLAPHPYFGMIVRRGPPWTGHPEAVRGKIKAVNEYVRKNMPARCTRAQGITGWTKYNGKYVPKAAVCFAELMTGKKFKKE